MCVAVVRSVDVFLPENLVECWSEDNLAVEETTVKIGSVGRSHRGDEDAVCADSGIFIRTKNGQCSEDQPDQI